jgi:hypothetical protein
MIIVSRQLGDYLPGGKFNIDSSPNFEKLKETSVNVSTTNIVSERDFANLDRLRREKPNANTIALEGMILFTNNKTLHPNWRLTMIIKFVHNICSASAVRIFNCSS